MPNCDEAYDTPTKVRALRNSLRLHQLPAESASREAQRCVPREDTTALGPTSEVAGAGPAAFSSAMSELIEVLLTDVRNRTQEGTRGIRPVFGP